MYLMTIMYLSEVESGWLLRYHRKQFRSTVLPACSYALVTTCTFPVTTKVFGEVIATLSCLLLHSGEKVPETHKTTRGSAQVLVSLVRFHLAATPLPSQPGSALRRELDLVTQDERPKRAKLH